MNNRPKRRRSLSKSPRSGAASIKSVLKLSGIEERSKRLAGQIASWRKRRAEERLTLKLFLKTQKPLRKPQKRTLRLPETFWPKPKARSEKITRNSNACNGSKSKRIG